jgi:hypothetical protein
MKEIVKKIIICMLLLPWASGCGYLDIVPDNTIEIEYLFENEEKAYKALSTCYTYMPDMEFFHQSLSLAGDEFCGRLDASVAESRSNCRGLKLMKGWQNSTDPILSYWNGGGGAKSLYQGIRICNIFLQNINDVPDMTPEDIADCTAQVKVLKAYFHFILIKLYGPIVIADQNIETSAEVDEVRQERKPVEECFQYVLGLLNEVLYGENGSELSLLPNQRTSSFYGQIDKVITKAIRAQVLLYRASPLFNGNSEYYSNFVGVNGEKLFSMDDDQEKWKEALDATEIAIAAAEKEGKKLYEYKASLPYWDEDYYSKSEIAKYCYNNRYSIVDAWNDELVWGYSGISWSTQGSFQNATQVRSLSNTSSTFSWQWLGATYKMEELFYSKNGVPIDEDKTYDYENRLQLTKIPEDVYHYGYMQRGETTVKLHLDREPRFYAWLAVDRSIWRTHTTAYDMKMRYLEVPGGRTAASSTDFYWTGIGIKKLVHPNTQNSYWQRIVKYPIPLIRLADLYLMYAECYNEYYGPNQNVYDKLNAVRARAGLLTPIEQVWNDGNIVKNVGKHLTQEGLRDIIQYERLVELCFEGHRYFDILRWKRAGEFFTTPLQGWNITGADPEQFYQLSTLETREWVTPKNYLFPIPLNDLNRNPKLVQNPGY